MGAYYVTSTYTIQDFGPSDLLTSDKEAMRRVKTALPDQLFDGDKAMTVQSFLELNCKAGNQWETAGYRPALAALANADTIIVTGSKHVLLKDMYINFDSLLLGLQFFKAPTYTGGTVRTVYNLHENSGTVSTIQILDGATVTAPGTPISPQLVALGSELAGNRRNTQFAPQLGVERIFSPDSVYLVRSTNLDSANAARVSSISAWYEGPLSVDVPIQQ